ncbi:MAG: SDR family oxidoreductase [Gammaproteobacteria bacterium]|nr:SDR family oxidoreductase [Gammaproteobacteria bacterium]
MGDLAGKTIIVTGAASGIGAATAAEILARDGNVVATDIDWSQTGACGSDRADGARLLRLPHDVSRAADWVAVIDAALEKFARIDGLVNNAGRYLVKPLEHTSLAEWQSLTDVNVKGVFLGCRAVHPVMSRQGGGSIVNVVSAAGLQYFPGMAAYSASKSAVAAFNRAAMIDFAKDNIRVNGVLPGTVRTGMTRELLDSPEFVEQVIGKHVLRRAAEPEEIAAAVVFLLTDDACYVNGINLPVDGGLTLS